MSDQEQQARDIAFRLLDAIERKLIPQGDIAKAKRCLRRLRNPLRLTVFGDDAELSISLLNLLVGRSIVAKNTNCRHIWVTKSDEVSAVAKYRSGQETHFKGDKLREIFSDRPSQVKFNLNLPSLNKVSFLVLTENTPEKLIDLAEPSVLASDACLWVGDAVSDAHVEMWNRLPRFVRDHSYLVLRPEQDIARWASLQSEFADVLTIDAKKAQIAKDNGDKEAFRAAGGTEIVRKIKSEVTNSMQAAIDLAEVRLLSEVPEVTMDAPAPKKVEMKMSAANDPKPVAPESTDAGAAKNEKPRQETGVAEKTEKDTNSGEKKTATPWSLGL